MAAMNNRATNSAMLTLTMALMNSAAIRLQTSSAHSTLRLIDQLM